MKRIKEIFYSIQGEGMNTGRPAIFVRFSGCNLKCPFCDTEHMGGEEMTDEQIVAEVSKYPARLVVFTGGEPTLQLTTELCDKIKKAGKYIAIETNGTRPIPVGVDFVTLSPKVEFCKGAEIVIKRADELKVVFNGKNHMKKYQDIKCARRYLQPCDTGDPEKNQLIIQQCVEYIKKNTIWTLSLQTQKVINVQ